MKLSCVIVDDDLNSVNLLIEYISLIPNLKLIASYTDSAIAKEKIANMDVHLDFLFTDVEMPNLSGLELAAELNSKVNNIVLVSAHAKYAIDGYRFNVKEYIHKPFSFPQFESKINRLITESPLTKDSSIIKLPGKNNFSKIFHKDIIAIEGCGNYIKIHTKNTTYVPYYKLSTIETELRFNNDLIRVSKSFIVSIKYFESTKDSMIILQNGLKVKISVPYRKTIKFHLEKSRVT